MYTRLIVAALTAIAACGVSAQTDESVGASPIPATPTEAGQPEMTGPPSQVPGEASPTTTPWGTLPEVTPSSTFTEEETGTLSDDAARCGGPCPGKPTPPPAPLPSPCPGGCPPPPKPTYCDVCPPPVNTYTPPPSPPQPTCDTDCPITLTISMPPKPTQTCPPRPDCNIPKYNKYYKYGYKSGTGLTNTLLKGHDDCADVDNTVRTLQDNAPSYPSTLGSSPSLYCRKLGVYTGFLDAVDVFEKKCTVQCRDDGAQIGAQAAILLCNLPTARIARVDLCQISFDAGCALSFEQTIRDYCPSELNTERFKAVKSQVCAFMGPAK